MKCSIENLCRGEGKIFVLFSFLGADYKTAKLETYLSKGKRVPSSLYPYDDDCTRFVAVLPQLKNQMTLSFSFFDEKGAFVDSCERAVNPARAKWQSRINYRMHLPECRKIRNFDKYFANKCSSLELTNCILDGDETIVRAKIRTPHCEENDVRLSFFDENFEPMDVEPIHFGRKTISSQVAKSLLFDEDAVSFRIPASNQSCVITMESSQHPELYGFFVLDRAEREGKQGMWASARVRADQDPRYPEWFERNRVTKSTVIEQSFVTFDYEPTFSIIVPLFETPIPLFKDMLLSVKKQSYKNWELILVNASPKNKNLAAAVAEACRDERVSCVTTPNLGISGNTKLGVDASKGDYICFFDHDDVLEPNILFEYVKAINQSDKKVDALYCDEDKLRPDGSYALPFFKPDFSIDLLRSFNYVCHMLCVRKETLDKIDFPDSSFDGAQDHDIILKVSEIADQILHVQKVLYHWRMTENSTAAAVSNKSYASEAGLKAVKSHLSRLGIDAKVSLFDRPFSYKVNYLIGEEHPLVSIIIPSKDAISVLDKCITSIYEKSTYDNFEVIIIENNSVEESTFKYYEEIQAKYPTVRVEYWAYEFNYSKLTNFGVEKARGDYLLLLNNDTEVITPDWMERLLGFCLRSEVGAVGVRLLYPDNIVQHAGVRIGGDCAGHLDLELPRNQRGYFNLDDSTRNLSAVTAACLLTRRDVYESVGGFTEELAVAFNDVDYCLKVGEKGFLVVYTPDVELYHYESFSRGYEDNYEKKLRFFKESAYINSRWPEYFVKGDPFMNPNFSVDHPFCWFYGLRI